MSSAPPTASPRFSALDRRGLEAVGELYRRRDDRPVRALAAYLSLYPGKGRLFPLALILGNIKHAPSYLFPLLLSYVIDTVIPSGNTALLWWVGAVSLALAVGNIFLHTLYKMLVARRMRAVTAGLRTVLMRQLQRLSLSYHDRARGGHLQHKFLLDMERIEQLGLIFTDTILISCGAIAAMLAISFVKEPIAGAMLLIVVPLNVAVAVACRRRLISTSRALREEEARFSAFVSESLTGIRVARAHGIEDRTEHRVRDEAGVIADAGVRYDKQTAIFGSVRWAVNNLFFMLVICLGGWLVMRGEFEEGELVLFAFYFQSLSAHFSMIFDRLPQISAGATALQSLGEVLANDEREENEGKPTIDRVSGHLRFEQVTFSYSGTSEHQLEGVDLDLPPGGALALVGPSGSGKSTCAALALGFYLPQQGRVLLDGHDLATIDRRSMRRHVGLVAQDVILFHDTVLGNIAWGDAEPSLARAVDAARRANAHGFIEALPAGYDTMIGERGATLSGGQQQRLAIARALYRDPRLLVLDEATSALDAESEALVQEALEEVMRDRTSIIIAHRLTTVRNADRIAVLDQGRLIESGSFDELMQRRGAFWELARRQLR